MNDKEIFNHLLAMSLKISADRRLKAKRRRKMKKDEIKFSVDRLLDPYPIFECPMCNMRFILKSQYYSHDCPNFEEFMRKQETKKYEGESQREVNDENCEVEENMPIFKIPKVPEIRNESSKYIKVPLPVENFKSDKIKKDTKEPPKKVAKNIKPYKHSLSNFQIPHSTKLFELLTAGVKKRRSREPKKEKTPQKPQLSFSIDQILGLDRCKN